MKVMEKRTIAVTYCDYCGKEIDGSYMVLHKPEGEVHLCNDNIPSCQDLYKHPDPINQIKNILGPEYSNSVYTWPQIRDALIKVLRK